MKKNFFLLLFFLVSIVANASSVIKGVIIDSGTQAPIDYASIALLQQGSQKFVKGLVSGKNGEFSISDIAEGKYILRVTLIGYTSINKQLTVNTSLLNLGQIMLTQDAKILQAVEVVSQGTQVKFDVDKKIYSVDQSIATAGGSASDVLKNIPSVKVDNEGNVSLRKDGNVEVWINGKPSGLTADNRAQILQQMPAETIESVEVMTNPSAKFNPEGTAGIINIVMKKNHKAGYYGSVSAGAIYPEGGGVRPNFGGSVNYSSSKLDANLSLGYRAMKFRGSTNTDRYNLNGKDTLSLFSQQSSMINEFGGLFGRGGISYRIDSLNTIGISGFGMVGSGISTNSIDYRLIDKSVLPGNVLNKYSRDNNGTGTRPSGNVSLDYRHDFSKESNLMASASYSSHLRGGDNQIVEKDSTDKTTLDFNQHTVGTNQELILKADYVNKFTVTSRLEAGWQTTLSHRISSSYADSLEKQLDNYKDKFDYNEEIHAGYVTYGDRFGNLSLQGGLRGELFSRHSTNTTADASVIIPLKSEFQLFPSFFASYSLPKNNELQLNYTRRVNRPRGRQINPFIDYSKSTVVSYGNPNLMPEYASAFELNYIKTWTNHSLSATGYYRFTDNGIENVRFKNGDIMENTYMNLSKRENSGLELVSKNRVLKAVNLTSTLNLYYSQLHASTYINPYESTLSTTIPSQSNFSWSANLMANFMLSRTLSGQITGEYSSPTVIAQGTQSPEYRLDLGLRKTFFDRKLTVGLIAIDILNLNKEKNITWGTGFYQKEESYFHRRMLGITASWSFGNMKPKNSDMKKQQNGSPEIMDDSLD